jgi:hypothetical protein
MELDITRSCGSCMSVVNNRPSRVLTRKVVLRELEGGRSSGTKGGDFRQEPVEDIIQYEDWTLDKATDKATDQKKTVRYRRN